MCCILNIYLDEIFVVVVSIDLCAGAIKYNRLTIGQNKTVNNQQTK